VSKIISESCELSKLYNINRSGQVFLRQFILFPYQTLWQYSDVDPLTRASIAGAVSKNRDSRPISGFHEILKYFKVKYFIVHLYIQTTQLFQSQFKNFVVVNEELNKVSVPKIISERCELVK